MTPRLRARAVRRASLAVFALGLVALVALPGPLSAAAAQPPRGYPTQQVVTTAHNSKLGAVDIRRGFYDGDIDQGWGMDKAWNKHNIWRSEAMRRVMLSDNFAKEGAQYALTAYAGKYTCPNRRCVLTDQREVRGILETRSFDTYYGWPVGGKMGQLTMYCVQGGVVRCPNWVTFSITNPGQHNPYSTSKLNPETALPPAYRADQEAILNSREIKALMRDIERAEAAVTYSYRPLPREVDRSQLGSIAP